jgi:hypothetical protein
MKLRLPLLAAVVAVGAITAIVAGVAVSGQTKEAKTAAALLKQVESSARTKRMVPPATLAQIVQLRSFARQLAASMGEKAPTRIRAVPTTRMAANQLEGGTTVNTDQNVIMVTMHGRFLNGSSPVDGSPLPPGSVLTFMYDLNAGQLTDYAVQLDDPNIAQLGAVQEIPSG